uniref:Gag-pol polyprotein n=1 Tax=Gossypium raimondii TaxID=29730 RepID=A0A0D2UVM7_GOSRA|nr:hypothetical protein B456_011G188300 [Gossypium raimondii]
MHEFERIAKCTIAKDAWVETTHEGTSTVKQSKMQMLTSRFKSLWMQELETIGEYYAKLSDLSNQAFASGEEYSNAKIIRNVLRSFLERFSIKVTIIEEAKNLEKLAIDEFIGSLQTFEMNLNEAKCIMAKRDKSIVTTRFQ